MSLRPPRRRTSALAVAGLVLGAVGLAVGSGVLPSPMAVPRPTPATRPDVPASEPPRSPRPPGPAMTVEAEDFGATGDGRTDDTAALQAALDQMRPGDTLALRVARTYRHVAVLRVRSPRTLLVGPGSLLATDEERSALSLEADGVQVRDLTLRIATTTRRWSGVEQHRLLLGPHAGLRVLRVVVEGSAASGIFVRGSTGFTIDEATVRDTRADGIHMTDGASGGRVTRATVERSGDDGVAVVSYGRDARICRDIVVQSPTVRSTTGGRGLSVVGGEDVVYRDVAVSDTRAAGIYIATEGAPFFTRDTRRVRVVGGSVSRANQDADIDHGAILVYAGRDGSNLADVAVSDLVVRDTRKGARRQVGVLVDRASVEVVALTGLTVVGGGPLLEVAQEARSTRALDWLVDGRAIAVVEPL